MRVFRGLIIFSMILALAICSDAKGLTSLFGSINWSCINVQVMGLCFKKTYPYVGIKINYREPALLIETVKKPGDFVIDEYGSIFEGLLNGVSTSLLNSKVPVSSGGGNSSLSSTNLRFNEVHVYSFPFSDIFTSMFAADCEDISSTPGSIKYLSELDSLEWRMGLFENATALSVPAEMIFPVLKNWGHLYPRTGFTVHQSDVVVSAIDAIKAISISSIDNIIPHMVVTSIGFSPNYSKDRLQQIYPNSSRCIKIGENPLFWESNMLSSNGKYLWVYWRYKECCIY